MSNDAFGGRAVIVSFVLKCQSLPAGSLIKSKWEFLPWCERIQKVEKYRKCTSFLCLSSCSCVSPAVFLSNQVLPLWASSRPSFLLKNVAPAVLPSLSFLISSCSLIDNSYQYTYVHQYTSVYMLKKTKYLLSMSMSTSRCYFISVFPAKFLEIVVWTCRLQFFPSDSLDSTPKHSLSPLL